MADTLQFEFEPTGEADLVKAIDDAKKGLAQIDTVLQKHAALEKSLRAEAVSEMRKEAAERRKLGAERVQNAERFGAAERASSRAWTTEFQRVGSAAAGAKPHIADFRQGVTGIGKALSVVAPEAGKAVGAISSFGGSITSAITTMGPWGIVIGAVTASIAYMANGIAEADAEAKKWTDRLNNETIPTLDEFISKIQASQRAQSLASQRAMNVAGPTDALARQNLTAAELQVALNTRRALAANGDRSSYSYHENLDRADAEIARRREANANAQREARDAAELERQIQQGEAENFVAEAVERGRAEAAARERAGRTGRRGGGSRRRPGPESRVYAEDLGRSGTGGADSYVTDELGRFLTQSQDAKGGNDVTRIDAQRRMEDDLRAQQLDQEREWYAERTRRRDAYYDSWASKGAEVGAVFGDLLNTVASGESTLLQAGEKLFKQFLQNTAKSESIEAGKAFAKAIGAAFLNPAEAVALAAEGAAHLAVAAAAGGAQAIVSGGGGGSGQSDRARPDNVGGDASSGAGLTINLNAPAVVTEGGLAALARDLRGAMGADGGA